MNKKVYLFELDSVRNSNQEILAAQEALFEEIAINGNTVVMSFNQFFDSRGFLNLFRESSEYAQYILDLFECGALKLSQFGRFRSGTQYLINLYDTAVLPEEAFDLDDRLSGLPVKYGQRRLIRLMVRSLENNDISEISEYIDILKKGSMTADEREMVDELFIETASPKEIIANNQDCERVSKGMVSEYIKTDVSGAYDVIDDDMKQQVLETLKYSLKVIFKVSALDNVYNGPKLTGDMRGQQMNNYLLKVISLYEVLPKEYKRSVRMLANILFGTELLPLKYGELDAEDCILKDRRALYTSISVYPKKEKRPDSALYDDHEDVMSVDRMHCKAIIDLCYNYSVESSISNISRHYDIGEITENLDGDSFKDDFLIRLENYTPEKHNFENANIEEPFDVKLFKKTIKDMGLAVEMFAAKKDGPIADNQIGSYEYHLDKERRVHRLKVGLRAFVMGVISLTMLGVMYLISQKDVIAEFFLLLNKDVSSDMNNSMGGVHAIYNGALIIILWICFEFIMERLPCFQSVPESVNGIVTQIKIMFKTVFYKVRGHRNRNFEGALAPQNETGNIRFVPKAIKEYCQMMKRNVELFNNIDEYPILDEENMELGKIEAVITRQAEVFSQNLGVVYKDKYHYVMVDPVVNEKSGAFPYARVINANPNAGIVMIPKCKGKYILLRQARHALRSYQYGFPRGFAESENIVEDDIIREMEEEIGGAIRSYKIYGRVSGDSGIISTRPYIVSVELDSYDNKLCSEGITDIIEVTGRQLKKMVDNKMIDDECTLAALELEARYSKHIRYRRCSRRKDKQLKTLVKNENKGRGHTVRKERHLNWK